jgi:hypothetical protein
LNKFINKYEKNVLIYFGPRRTTLPLPLFSSSSKCPFAIANIHRQLRLINSFFSTAPPQTLALGRPMRSHKRPEFRPRECSQFRLVVLHSIANIYFGHLLIMK